MIIMNKTYTPELTPEVLDRLEDYADRLPRRLQPTRQAAWSGVYLRGLLHDGERKSIEPIAARVTLPAGPRRPRTPSRPCSSSSTRAPGTSRRWPGAIAGTWPRPSPAPRGSSSSTTPASPSRASTPSASSGSTAAPWARRPTARSPPRSTTSAPRATTRWRCGCSCPSPGSRTRSGWTRRACPRPYRRAQTKGADRPGVARHGPRRRAAGVARRGRRRLRGLGGRSATAWPQRGLNYIVGVTDEMVVFTEEPRWESPGRAAGTGGRPRTPAPAGRGARRGR